MYDILVIGSINADLVFSTERRPDPGETVLGKGFATVPGGKGANQAVAASRLGASVGFIGCVGNDSNGKLMLENLAANKVGIKGINTIDGIPTGVAGIIISKGENSIIVIPGANHCVDKEQVDSNIDLIRRAKLVVLQLEIPIETVEHIVEVCYEEKVPVILNPAPAGRISDTTVKRATYITPNESELRILFGEREYPDVLSEYPNKLILTQGKKGAAFHDGNNLVEIPGQSVEAIDTTGAGDTFNGALAAGLVEGMELKEAISFANSAAAISVTKLGAQGGMPVRSELAMNNEQ